MNAKGKHPRDLDLFIVRLVVIIVCFGTLDLRKHEEHMRIVMVYETASHQIAMPSSYAEASKLADHLLFAALHFFEGRARALNEGLPVGH